MSDHLPSFYIADSNSQKQPNFIFRRVFNDHNILNFKAQLNHINWHSVFHSYCPNDSYDLFLKIYQRLYNNNFPVKKVSVVKTDTKPWLTTALKTSIKIKNKLYKYYIKHYSLHVIYQYINYRNKLTHLLRIAKKYFFSNKLDKVKNNIKQTWKLLNNIMGTNILPFIPNIIL